MPQERSDMRRVKEVLRLAHELGYSNRQIQESVRMGRTSVGEYLARAREGWRALRRCGRDGGGGSRGAAVQAPRAGGFAPDARLGRGRGGAA